MLGSKLVLGIRLLSLGNRHDQKQSGHLQHAAQPRLIIIDHRFGNSQVNGVVTGGSVREVVHKLKGNDHDVINVGQHNLGKDEGHAGAHHDVETYLPPGGNKDVGQSDKHTSTSNDTGGGSGFTIIRDNNESNPEGSKHHDQKQQPEMSEAEVIDQYIKILKTPGLKFPHPWWTQCYNDRVHDCAPTITHLEEDMKRYPQSVLLQHYRQSNAKFNNPASRTVAVMMRLLADIPLNEGDLPLYHYLALEMLLGMGFMPARITSLSKRTVDVSPFIPPTATGQIDNHLVSIARLGLHRLLAGVMDVGLIRFSKDNAEFRNLLIEAREQPYSLTQILKRIVSPFLRLTIATDCPQCNPLAMAIHKLLAVKLPAPLAPLCLPNGSHPTIPLQTGLATQSAHMNRQEQVMLARAVLYLVFDVPFFATACPRCVNLVEVPKADAKTLVNAMLECYCSPHTKFHLIS